jgi:hypothetical protein
MAENKRKVVKLARDFIPEICEKSNFKAIFYVANDI